MNAGEYQKLAAKTIGKHASYWNMVSEAAMGMCSESGEVAGLIKKSIYQGQRLEKEHVKEELGDVLWYAFEMMTVMDFTPEEVMAANVEKLKARYPECFEEKGGKS